MSVPPPRRQPLIMAAVIAFLLAPFEAVAYLWIVRPANNCVYDNLSYNASEDYHACMNRLWDNLFGPPSWTRFLVIFAATLIWGYAFRSMLLRYWYSQEFRAWLWERRRDKYYRFDQARGEWRPITGRQRGLNTVLFNKEDSRADRLLKEHLNFSRRIGINVIAFWAGPAFWLGYFVNFYGQSLDKDFTVWIFSPFMILPLIWAKHMLNCRNKLLVIDPPAVRPDMKPYGEATPFAPPAASAGSDETDYEFPA